MSIDITQNPVFLKDGKKITIEDFDIETDVHDPDREMGAELVHTVKANIDDVELEWLVYEYAYNINHVDFNKYNDSEDKISLVEEAKFDISSDDDMDYEQEDE
jgi:hypothetical protein